MKILNAVFWNILLFSTDLFSVVELPFGISFLEKGPKTQVLYGAAHPNYSAQGIIKDSALFQFDGVTVRPITPETVAINVANVGQPNPLYDQGIRSLDFITPEQKELPVVLSTADLQRIYVFESVETGSLLVSQILKDSQGDDTSLIQGLSASVDGTIFTVTYPNQGLLGDSGTGVGVVTRGYVDINSKSQRIFTQIALNNAVSASACAFPFDLSSPAFVFNNRQAQSFENPVLCWDDSLQCLYLGLTATGSAAVDGGVKGIAVFSIKGGVPSLISLIDDQVLLGNDDLLLSSQGSFGSVSISKIDIMHTSTGLPYLIAVVGFGVDKEIRVLPLVDNQGTVAAKTSTVSTLYLQSSRYAFFQKRIFDQPALSPTDLFAKTELPVLVGADETLSALLYQNMNDCFVQGDSIFLTVNTPDTPEQSGIFFSRALFGSDGQIVAWTRWQRAQETTDLFLAVPDLKQGGFYTATGTDFGHLFTVSKSEWKLGVQSSYAFLDDLLQKYLLSDGYDLSFMKVLFEPNRIDNSILFASGSYGKLLVNVLGTVNEQGIVVKQSVNNVQTIVTENTMELAPQTTTIIFSDPVLQSVGFITDCAYAYRQNPDEEFLVISGSGGVALLVQADFSGWSSDLGIGNNFSNLILPVQWIILEDQEYVKKVIADNQYLYLVSDTRITRINLDESDLSNQIIDKIIIADINDFENTQAFIDYIPSQSHAVLSTTNGLYYTDLNSSVQTDDVLDIIWHNVVLPESVLSIEHVQVITQSGNPVDMTRNEGSQIIVSATSQSNKRGIIVRATVDQDGIVVCFNDNRIRGAQSHLIDYGAFIKSAYSDGAFWYALIKSGVLQLRPCLIGFVPLEPSTPFLGLMPSYISLFNRLERFLPRSVMSLPTGSMMITTNKEFAITE